MCIVAGALIVKRQEVAGQLQYNEAIIAKHKDLLFSFNWLCDKASNLIIVARPAAFG